MEKLLEKLKGKNIFITGGAGFIGSTLAKVLLPNNKVVIYDSFARNAIKNTDILNHPNLTLIEGGSKFDVGIVIAKNETLQGRMVTGFKLFEYMSSGLAIIASKSYPINNVFKEGEIGAFYKETTASEIAKTINYLVEHPEKVNEMKKESYKLSTQKYNFEKQSEELLRIINEI